MINSFDILIVGGGISGSALLYELSRAGLGRVALLEAGLIASAITGDSGGYIRKFNTDPYLAQLASESFDYYQNFDSEVGGSCDFKRTGLVSRVNATAYDALKEQISSLQSSGHEVVISDKPPIKCLQESNYDGNDQVFIYEPSLGSINTKLTCRNWVDAAARNGAIAFENVRVEEVLSDSSGIIGVRTSVGFIACKLLIMSAGAWSKDLLSNLPIDTSAISSRSFQYNIYDGAAKFMDTAFMDNIEGFYTAPFRNGSVFAGTLGEDREVESGNFSHENDELAADKLHKIMEQHFHWVANASRRQLKRSYDAYTQDGRGIVRTFSEVPGLVLASGWSSGGIKSAPAIAKHTVKLVSRQEIIKGGVYAYS